MFRIYHFSLDSLLGSADPKLELTDYEPKDLEEAESIVTDLNRDAIESSLPDRWTIMSLAE